MRIDGEGEWQDWLEDETANQAAEYEASDELEVRLSHLSRRRCQLLRSGPWGPAVQ